MYIFTVFTRPLCVLPECQPVEEQVGARFSTIIELHLSPTIPNLKQKQNIVVN